MKIKKLGVIVDHRMTPSHQYDVNMKIANSEQLQLLSAPFSIISFSPVCVILVGFDCQEATTI